MIYPSSQESNYYNHLQLKEIAKQNAVIIDLLKDLLKSIKDIQGILVYNGGSIKP